MCVCVYVCVCAERLLTCFSFMPKAAAAPLPPTTTPLLQHIRQTQQQYDEENLGNKYALTALPALAPCVNLKYVITEMLFL